MNILLVNPPRENEIIGNNPTIIEEERGVNPPLGLLYVGAYLEQYYDNITIIDAQVEKLDYETLAYRIRSAKPEIVGLTTMTMTLIDVLKVVELVKTIDHNIHIVLGGPHVHLFPEETINLKGVDFLVLGEGEETFKKLLDNIKDKENLKKIPGIVFKDGDKIINTGKPAFVGDLNALPFPARHLVPYTKYTSLLSKGSIVTTVITSRGCPFDCTFCDRPHLGKRFRYRSPMNVVDELEECVNLGIDEFLFYDDTFTINKQRVLDICKEIVKRKLYINFDIRTRVDTINDELLKHLKMAGCNGIHYGVEAGTEKILNVLNKGITIEKVKKVFTQTIKHKIPILAYFMIGNPTETLENIMSTFEVMKKLNPDYVHLTILTPFPGTKIYFNGLKEGIIKRDVWREFAQNPTPNFVPPHWDENFSLEELNDLLVKGYKVFYQRPTYIFKRLLAIRSFAEFKSKAHAGLKVFNMKTKR